MVSKARQRRANKKASYAAKLQNHEPPSDGEEEDSTVSQSLTSALQAPSKKTKKVCRKRVYDKIRTASKVIEPNSVKETLPVSGTQNHESNEKLKAQLNAGEGVFASPMKKKLKISASTRAKQVNPFFIPTESNLTHASLQYGSENEKAFEVVAQLASVNDYNQDCVFLVSSSPQVSSRTVVSVSRKRKQARIKKGKQMELYPEDFSIASPFSKKPMLSSKLKQSADLKSPATVGERLPKRNSAARKSLHASFKRVENNLEPVSSGDEESPCTYLSDAAIPEKTVANDSLASDFLSSAGSDASVGHRMKKLGEKLQHAAAKVRRELDKESGKPQSPESVQENCSEVRSPLASSSTPLVIGNNSCDAECSTTENMRDARPNEPSSQNTLISESASSPDELVNGKCSSNTSNVTKKKRCRLRKKVARDTENVEVSNVTFKKFKVFSLGRLRKNVFRLEQQEGKIVSNLSVHYTGSPISAKLKALNLVKWCLVARKRLIAQFKNMHECLRKECESLLLVAKESTSDNRSEIILGCSEHISSAEGYYHEISYNPVSPEDSARSPLVVTETGKIVNIFPNVEPTESKGGGYKWSCGSVCKTNETDIVEKTEEIYRQLSQTSELRHMVHYLLSMNDCGNSTCKESLEKKGHSLSCWLNDGGGAPFVFLQSRKAHYPKLRALVRRLQDLEYKLRNIDDLDFSLYNQVLLQIESTAEKAQVAGGEFEVGTQTFATEDDIEKKYKPSFKAYSKKMADLPNENYCFCCERQLNRHRLHSLSNLKKAIHTEAWDRMLEYAIAWGASVDHICDHCQGKLKNNEIPAISTLNKMNVRPVPPEIQALNSIEKQLIQRAKPFQVVTRADTVMGKKNVPAYNRFPKVKGSTFHLTMPIGETLKRILRDEQAVMPNQEWYILLRSLPTNQKKIWESCVSVPRVIAALKWLKIHNPLYARIEIPEAAKFLDCLQDPLYKIDDPENPDDPDSSSEKGDEDLAAGENQDGVNIADEEDDLGIGPANSAEGIPAFARNVINEPNYPPRNPDDQPDENHSADVLSGANLRAMLTQCDGGDEYYANYTIFPVYSKREGRLASETYQMLKVEGQSLDPRAAQLDAKCFPDLFPYGDNYLHDVRDVNVPFTDFVHAQLLSRHSRFRKNIQYLFFLLNQATNRQIAAGVFQVLNVTRQKLTAGEFLDKLSDGDLEREMNSVFRRVRNTEEFWVVPRCQIFCMIDSYGPPTFFLTLSPAEWNDSELHQFLAVLNEETEKTEHSAGENSAGAVEKNVQPKAKKKKEVYRVSDHPVEVCRFYEQKLQAMLAFLSVPEGGPLGIIEHYVFRREYQSRGQIHFHLLLWVKDAPILGKATSEEVAQFIQDHITCHMPDSKTFPTLHAKVTEYQMHRCNPYCLRSKKNKITGVTSMVCRFGFPRPHTDKLVLRDVPTSVAGRRNLVANTRLYDLIRKEGEERVNDYNPAILMRWCGNMDLQYVGEVSTILGKYVSKYQTKAEKSNITDVFDDMSSTKSLCSRLWKVAHRGIANRECGVLETVDSLLSYPLIGFDRHTTVRWIDVSMFRSRKVKSRKEVEKLDRSDTDLFYPSIIDTHYPSRPEELENTCLYDYVKHWDIVDNKPTRDPTVEFFEYGRKYLRKRKIPHLINHYHYDAKQKPEAYFYCLLLLFKPWRTIDEFKGTHATYADAFKAEEGSLREAMLYHEKLVDIQKAHDAMVDLIEEKSKEFGDKEPENDPHAAEDLANRRVEAEQAMHEFREAANNDPEEDLASLESQLNSDQRRVYELVKQRLTEYVQNEDPELKNPLRHIVSGYGGVGKSFLIKTITVWVRQELKKDIAITAPTGLAAWALNGATIFRILQLPIMHGNKLKYERLSDAVLNVLRSELKNVVAIIIDEISMVSNVMLMMIHLRLSEIFDTFDTAWFGNINIILFGDLLQLPPVKANPPFVKMTSKEKTKHFVTMSDINLWQTCFTYDELTINMRQKNDESFSNLLANIRLGFCSKADLETLLTRKLPLKGFTPEERLNDLAQFIINHPKQPMCLVPTRAMCAALNKAILKLLPGEEVFLIAEDSVDCKMSEKTKAYAKLKKLEEDCSRTAGLEKIITVKVGARVMLKRNIDVSQGFVNGASGVILKIVNGADGVPNCLHLLMKNGKILELTRTQGKFEMLPGIFVRRLQFSICLSYCSTIHKGQGLSLDCLVIDIGNKTFAKGQAYVALSRAKTLDGVYIINIDPKEIQADLRCLKEYERLRSMTPHLKHLPTEICPGKQEVDSINDDLWAPPNRAVQGCDNTPTRKKAIKKVLWPAFSNEDGVSSFANANLQCLLSSNLVRPALKGSSQNSALKTIAGLYQPCARVILSAKDVRLQAGQRFAEKIERDPYQFLHALIDESEVLKKLTRFSEVIESKCNSCRETSEDEIDRYILQLPMIQSGRKITQLLESLSTWSELQESVCSRSCNGKISQRPLIKNASDLLIVHLKSQDRNDKGEIIKNTKFHVLTLPWVNITIGKCQYKLHSTLFYHGESGKPNHCTAFIRSGRRFILTDDLQNTQCPWPDRANNAYLLFYQKIGSKFGGPKKKLAMHEQHSKPVPTVPTADMPRTAAGKISATKKMTAVLLEWPAFRNDGVSCYAIASLQSLLSHAPLRQTVLRDAPAGSALKALAGQYCQKRSQALLSAVETRKEVHDDFALHIQHDAQEFLQHLLAGNDVLKSFTKFTEFSERKCSNNNCNSGVSSRAEEGYLLPIPTDGRGHETAVKISTLLEDLFSWSPAPSHDDPVCQSCEGGRYQYRTRIENPSDMIVLHLKLWESKVVKVDGKDVLVWVKKTYFRMTNLPSTDITISGHRYRLHAVIRHHGADTTKGHYTAIVRTGRQFILADDHKISQYRWQREYSDVYVLFYSKI